MIYYFVQPRKKVEKPFLLALHAPEKVLPQPAITKSSSAKSGKSKRRGKVTGGKNYPRNLKELFAFKPHTYGPNGGPYGSNLDGQGDTLRFGAGDSIGERMDKSNEILPYMRHIWSHIKNQVYYHPHILAQKTQGIVHVQIRVDPHGKLLFLNESGMQGPLELRGWVIHGVLAALENPILNHPMKKPMEIELHFLFKIFAQPPPPAEYVFDEQHLSFAIRGYIPAYGRFMNNQQGYSNVVSDTLLKDINFYDELEFYKKACDFRGLEYGCAKAAVLNEKIYRRDAAKDYHRKACKGGVQESCASD